MEFLSFFFRSVNTALTKTNRAQSKSKWTPEIVIEMLLNLSAHPSSCDPIADLDEGEGSKVVDFPFAIVHATSDQCSDDVSEKSDRITKAHDGSSAAEMEICTITLLHGLESMMRRYYTISDERVSLAGDTRACDNDKHIATPNSA